MTRCNVLSISDIQKVPRHGDEWSTSLFLWALRPQKSCFRGRRYEVNPDLGFSETLALKDIIGDLDNFKRNQPHTALKLRRFVRRIEFLDKEGEAVLREEKEKWYGIFITISVALRRFFGNLFFNKENALQTLRAPSESKTKEAAILETPEKEVLLKALEALEKETKRSHAEKMDACAQISLRWLMLSGGKKSILVLLEILKNKPEVIARLILLMTKIFPQVDDKTLSWKFFVKPLYQTLQGKQFQSIKPKGEETVHGLYPQVLAQLFLLEPENPPFPKGWNSIETALETAFKDAMGYIHAHVKELYSSSSLDKEGIENRYQAVEKIFDFLFKQMQNHGVKGSPFENDWLGNIAELSKLMRATKEDYRKLVYHTLELLDKLKGSATSEFDVIFQKVLLLFKNEPDETQKPIIQKIVEELDSEIIGKSLAKSTFWVLLSPLETFYPRAASIYEKAYETHRKPLSDLFPENLHSDKLKVLKEIETDLNERAKKELVKKEPVKRRLKLENTPESPQKGDT
jgi:hypothetical protein